MKKKVAFIVLLSMLFMGVVSAAGLHGTFEGNRIVKVTSEGHELTVEGVPAVNLNGRTMVPISMLRQLGADVTWDGMTETVNIKMPDPTINVVEASESQIKNTSDFIDSTKRLLPQRGIQPEKYEAVVDEYGMYIYAVYDVGELSSEDMMYHLSVLGMMPSMLDYPELTETIIQVKVDGTVAALVTINVNDALDFTNEIITYEQFTSRWKIKASENNIFMQNNVSKTPNHCDSIEEMYEESYKEQRKESKKYLSMSDDEYDKRYLEDHEERMEISLMTAGCVDGVSAEEGQNIAACKAINDDYDALVRQTEESHNARGMFRSSSLSDAINRIEQERNDELLRYKCY